MSNCILQFKKRKKNALFIAKSESPDLQLKRRRQMASWLSRPRDPAVTFQGRALCAESGTYFSLSAAPGTPRAAPASPSPSDGFGLVNCKLN